MEKLINLITSSEKGAEQFLKNMIEINKDNEDYWYEVFVLSGKESVCPDSFIIDNIELFMNKYYLKYAILSNNVLNEFIDNDIFNSDLAELFLKTQKLDDKMLEQYLLDENTKVDWLLLQEYQNLSSDFIYKYERYLDWKVISQEQYMNLEFIIKNINKLDWNLMITNIKLQPMINEGFISLFQKQNIWDNIGWCNNIDVQTLLKYQNCFTVKSWTSILEFKDLTDDEKEIFKLHVEAELFEHLIMNFE